MSAEGSTEIPSQGTSGESSKEPNENKGTNNDDNSRFECNICLDTAKDAVVSHCGHLFCWPCLVQWLDTRPNRQVCPVCKALISRDKVIPLYGRGGNESDPRDKVPPRPRAQRQEAPQGFPGFHFGENGTGGGMHFSLGIGVFPFSMFANFFNSSMDRRPDPPNIGSQQHQEEQFLGDVFLYLGIIFIAWLILL